MPLDPMIAGGFRGIELQNPLEAYGRIAQIQNMQQQNALNALQMQKAQRELNVENQLAQLYARPDADIRSPAFLREVFAVSPVKGAAMQKSAFEAEKEDRLARAAQADFAAKRMKLARDMLPSVTSPETYASWRENTVKDLPGLASLIPAEYSPETTRALMLEADKALEQHFVSQNLGGAQQVLAMPKYGAGAAQLVPGSRVSDVPLPPEIEAQKARIAKAGASSTNVLPQEKAELGARGKLLVDQYKDVSKAASLAAKTLPSIETQQRILDSGFKTGFGTETQKAGASVLAALGVPEAEKYATNAQTFLAATQQAVLQKQLEQKGTQTQNDAVRIEQTNAQFGNTVDANKFIVSVAKAQLKRDIDQRNFYDKWWKANKTYDGAEDAWFSGEGGRSLFDRPELKQYASAAPGAPKRQSLQQIFGR